MKEELVAWLGAEGFKVLDLGAHQMDPDDEFAPFVIDYLGADKVVWAYDYPHSDSPTEPVKNLERLLGNLPEEDMRKVAGQNALDLYRLG